MSYIEIMEKIVKDYNLARPIPENIKREGVRLKKATLINILKEKGKYSLFVLAVIKIFFLLRKMSITVSIGKCFILSIVFTLSILGVLSYGGIKFVLNNIKEQEVTPPVKENVIIKTPHISLLQKRRHGTVKPLKAKNFFLGVVPFSFDEKRSNTSKSVSNAVAVELNKLIRNKKTEIFKNRPERIYKNLLLGSIIKQNGIFKINVRVVDKVTSQVLHYETVTANGRDDIKNACKRLSRKIADKINNKAQLKSK